MRTIFIFRNRAAKNSAGYISNEDIDSRFGWNLGDLGAYKTNREKCEKFEFKAAMAQYMLRSNYSSND